MDVSKNGHKLALLGHAQWKSLCLKEKSVPEYKGGERQLSWLWAAPWDSLAASLTP